ncbi:MAG: sugar phosphate isomerase/epimerase family protein [bacterium]
MKKSINIWAFPPNLSVREAFQLAKEAGLDGVELNIEEQGTPPYALPLTISEKEVVEIRKEAEQVGILLGTTSSGVHWQYRLTSPDQRVREKAVEYTKMRLRINRWLGANVLLLVPGAVSPEEPYDLAIERSRECIKQLIEDAEKNKVIIGVENVWNKMLLSPLEMRDFIDSIQSEWVGAYFDVGNVLNYSFPEQWIRILGQRIKAVHVKDFRLSVGNINGFVNLLEGDVNWPEVSKALKEINYQGFVTAELPPYKFHPELLIYETAKALDLIIKG